MCVSSVLVEGTQSGDEESSTRYCIIELTELVAAIVKGCVSIDLNQIHGVSSCEACRRLFYHTPRFNKMTNA